MSMESNLTRIFNVSNEEESWLGYSCASIGDFNGDGIGDVVVGAPGADSDIGRAYVIYGDASGIDDDFDLYAVEEGDHVGLLLSGTVGGRYSHSIGYAVAAAGDVNGDSFMDVIVAAYGSSYSEDGVAHVVYGTNTSAAYLASYLDLGAGDDGGLDGVDGFTLTGIQVVADIYANELPVTFDRQLSSQYTGNPVSSAGDANGDGYDDVLVGSPAAGTVSQGHAYLVFGGPDLPANMNLESNMTGQNGITFKGALTDEAGFSVSGGFDMNGDELSDFIIGAPEGGTLGEFDGEAYVIFGQVTFGESSTILLDTDLDGTNGFSIVGPSENAYAGSAVSGAGDVNCDGYDDVVVGAFGAEPDGRYRAGAAYVLFGRAEGTFEASYDLKSADVVDGTNAASLLGLRAQNALGIGVGSAGDMNGDGISDLWVGAPTADQDELDSAGTVYVVYGWQEDEEGYPWGNSVDLSALDGSAGYAVNGSTANGHFGWSGANVDLNHDGLSDLIVGAFVVPGLYVVYGDAGEADDNSTAIIAATVCGVLGCIFFCFYEARVWLAKKEAREEKERLANDPDAQAMGRWKMELGKKQAKDLKAQAAMRDINEGCEIVEKPDIKGRSKKGSG